MAWNANKVNGASFSGEHLTSQLDYLTIQVDADIRALGQSGGTTASQLRLDKLIEIISLKSQPIIQGAVTGTGPYVLKVAIEHTGAWVNTDLQTAIVANQGVLADGATSMGFSTVTVTIATTL